MGDHSELLLASGEDRQTIYQENEVLICLFLLASLYFSPLVKTKKHDVFDKLYFTIIKTTLFSAT